MKQLLFLFVCFFNYTILSAQDAFSINGKITGAAGKKIYLQPVKKTYAGFTDSAISADGGFSFQGTVTEPEQYKLSIEGQRGFFQFVLENKTVTINGTVDSIWRSVIDGSEETKNLAAFNHSIAPLVTKLNQSFSRYSQAKQSGDSVLSNQYMNDNENANTSVQQEALKFIKQNPSLFASLSIIEKFGTGGNSLAFIRSGLSLLDDKLRAHSVYTKLYQRLEADGQLATGKPAPDFVQNDAAGRPVQLASFRGKYVLIDFWASWCGPCRAENPDLTDLYKKYKSKGFEIIGISIDRDTDKSKWLQAIKEDKLTWPQLSDLKGGQNEVAVSYGVGAIPINYLIDPSGVIIGKNLRGEQLNKMIDSIFIH